MAGDPSPDKPVPLWHKIGVGAILVLVVVCLVVFHDRLSADFWPPDGSRVAPNILASLIQWAILAIAAVFLYPPWRRAAHRFVDAKMAPIHTHIAETRAHRADERRHRGAVLAHHEAADRQRGILEAKLDHIIKHHGDIPDFPEADPPA